MSGYFPGNHFLGASAPLLLRAAQLGQRHGGFHRKLRHGQRHARVPLLVRAALRRVPGGRLSEPPRRDRSCPAVGRAEGGAGGWPGVGRRDRAADFWSRI